MPKQTKPVLAVLSLCYRHIFRPLPEIPIQPDALDEPDASYVLQGLGVDDLRRVRQVRRV